MVESDFLLPSLGKIIQALNGVPIRFGHAEHRFSQSLFSVSATAVLDLDESHSRVGSVCKQELRTLLNIGQIKNRFRMLFVAQLYWVE